MERMSNNSTSNGQDDGRGLTKQGLAPVQFLPASKQPLQKPATLPHKFKSQIGMTHSLSLESTSQQHRHINWMINTQTSHLSQRSQ